MVEVLVLIESLAALLHYWYDRQLPFYTYEFEVTKNKWFTHDFFFFYNSIGCVNTQQLSA